MKTYYISQEIERTYLETEQFTVTAKDINDALKKLDRLEFIDNSIENSEFLMGSIPSITEIRELK